MTDQRVDKLPFWVKFGYGAADGSGSLIWTNVYVFFLFFLTDVVKLNPATAGLIIMVGTIWDAITDPMVGIWSDRTSSRYGRRRPFMLAAVLPYAVFSWLLFTDFGFSPGWNTIYFMLVVMFFFTSLTAMWVPYFSLAAEMTQDYDERTSLTSYKSGWSQVASLIGAGTTLILAQHFTKTLGNPRLGWSAMAAVFGAATILPILLTWRVTRGYEIFPEKTDYRIRDVVKATLRNRPFRYTIGAYVIGLMALNIAGAVMVYFMTYYMGFNEDQSSVAFLILFGCTVFWIPAINYASSRWGKRWALMGFLGAWALVMGLGTLMVKPEDVIAFYILMALAAGGVVAISLLGFAMITDTVEVDEFHTGQRREGVYFGVATFFQKVASAAALGINGLVLHLVGYVANQPQTDTALWGIRLLLSEGVAIFLVLSIIVCYLMPMTREKHELLRQAIALRRDGREGDLSGLEGVI
jgi:sugar (glycoside-pentoside-hexuronide) transporter